MCKINPRIDFAFKKLFGSEENKDLLISLINSILDPKNKIVDVTIRNPYNLQTYLDDKMSILDIKAVDDKGEFFNIEIQVGEDLSSENRAIYSFSKIITEQLVEGEMFRPLYKTISINILDFNLLSENPDFHNKYEILNEKTGKNDNLHALFEIHYIELRKFKKDFSDITTALDRWVAFLSKAHLLEKENLPETMVNHDDIRKAVTIIDQMFDEDEQAVYDNRLNKQKDIESGYESAKQMD